MISREWTAAAILTIALSACTAQSERMDQPSASIAGVPLTQNAQVPDAWSYIAPDANLAGFNKFILDPPVVYRGEGSDYGDLSDGEVQQIAQMFVDETRTALSPKYTIVTQPGPGVARLKFTLIAVSSTVPYVSTATRIIPIGAAINLIKGGTVGGGTLTGGVTYAIEAIDAQSGKVQAAAVRTLTPGAFDIEATLGTMDTARAVAKHAAMMLRTRLDGLHKS
jgi:hypothetical protein